MGGHVPLRRAAATILLGLGLAWLVLPSSVLAHGGHADEVSIQAMAGDSGAPQVIAQSDVFELVAVLQGHALTAYLDRFKDNTPITGAKIDVEVNNKTFSATANADGTYTIPAEWAAKAGRYDLMFTVTAGNASDLLVATLDVKPAAAAGSGTTLGALKLLPGASIAANQVMAFILGLLTMLLIVQTKDAASNAFARATALARETSKNARKAWHVRPKRTGRTAVRPTAAGIRSGIERQFTNARMRIALLAQPPVLATARRLGFADKMDVDVSVRQTGQAATMLTYGLIGIVVITLALVLVGRAVLAHSADEGGQVAAPAGQAAAESNAVGAMGAPHRLLDGTVFVPKTSQRLLNLRTMITSVGEVADAIRIAGHVIPDPGTSGQIHSTIRGRLEPVNGVWPQVGQKVKLGEVLAWVVPVINPIDRGIIYQQLAQIDHELALTEERIKTLTVKGSSATNQQVDDARSNLANLSRRRAAIATVLRDRDTLRAPLLSPADGIIATSFAVAGQLVDEQQKLFEVVNPKRLWVEAYAYDITKVGNITAADATSTVGQHYKLQFVSRGPQLQQQTIPLYFKIDDPNQSLSVGSIVSVVINTNGKRKGIIVPRSAVMRDTSGESIVWEHKGPESFVAVPVRVEPINGDDVLVVAGLKPNMRIVSTSADLLTEIR